MANRSPEMPGDQAANRLSAIRTSNVSASEVSSTASFNTSPSERPSIDVLKVNNALIILFERARQSISTCKDVIKFFHKRSSIERDYSKALQRAETSSLDNLEKSGGRVDSFVLQWQKVLEIHGKMGTSHYELSDRLTQMANDFTAFCEDRERVLKQIKEFDSQNRKQVEEAITSMEKTKHKYEVQSCEWERFLLKRNGRSDLSNQVAKFRNISGAVSGIFHKHKNDTPEMLEQLEQEARVKTKMCDENYKLQLTNTNRIRSAYYSEELPSAIKKTYDLVLEIDNMLKSNLKKYVYFYESSLLSDALLIKPTDVPGMGDIVDYIDNENDLSTYMQSMSKGQESPRYDNIPYAEYEMSPIAQAFANPRPIFGVKLETQLERDKKTIPTILTKCIHIIEDCGLQQEGLYRLSGQMSVINKLQADFDLDAEKVDLKMGIYKDDINNLTGLVKLYLRHIPGGIIPGGCCEKLSSIIDLDQRVTDRVLRHFRYEVEQLPHHNYEILKYLIWHFDKVQAFQEQNMMNTSNLSIVLGPTLVGVDPKENPANQFKSQARVVKFMIDYVREIFPGISKNGSPHSMNGHAKSFSSFRSP
ncbi:Rho GTPase-activating protein [Mycoemilia scoparia]|uniref:Rho GTPase-activating protein n=1 Tax=Mycoemilia scoparia TaxID=417184 RepID=A0A9W8A781_9FUNG|nr:Rho GTPase-activating protein [Mycoemilia scoparia]